MAGVRSEKTFRLLCYVYDDPELGPYHTGGGKAQVRSTDLCICGMPIFVS